MKEEKKIAKCSWHTSYNLTFNKDYVVYDEKDYFFKIKDDNKNLCWISKLKFYEPNNQN